MKGLYLRVGALIVASVALLIGTILLLTGNQLSKGHRYETYFRESVQGLDVGAPVKFRGVTLGRITNIGLVSAEYFATAEDQIMDPTYRLVVVRFKVDPKRIGRLPSTSSAVQQGLRAKLASQGLTGVMYLELDFVDAKRYPVDTVPWKPADDYLPSIPSTLAQVQDAATQVLRKLSAVDIDGLARNADGLLSDLRHEVQGGGDLQATLAEARATITALRAQIEHADLPALSAQLRKTGSAVELLAQGRQTRALLDRADSALARLPRLVDTLQAAASQAGTGVGDVEAEIMPILRDARATLENLREASAALRRDPGALLLQGAPPRRGQP